jgi:hypothetical protein
MWLCAARADLGLLDLMSMQDKLPGLLLYSVLVGGYDGNSLLQRASVPTVLGPATGGSYPLNFTQNPMDPTQARGPAPAVPCIIRQCQECHCWGAGCQCADGSSLHVPGQVGASACHPASCLKRCQVC